MKAQYEDKMWHLLLAHLNSWNLISQKWCQAWIHRHGRPVRAPEALELASACNKIQPSQGHKYTFVAVQFAR